MIKYNPEKDIERYEANIMKALIRSRLSTISADYEGRKFEVVTNITSIGLLTYYTTQCTEEDYWTVDHTFKEMFKGKTDVEVIRLKKKDINNPLSFTYFRDYFIVRFITNLDTINHFKYRTDKIIKIHRIEDIKKLLFMKAKERIKNNIDDAIRDILKEQNDGNRENSIKRIEELKEIKKNIIQTSYIKEKQKRGNDRRYI